MRYTIRRPVCFSGTGLHTGAPADVTIQPAAPGHGIRLYRADLPGSPMIPATLDSVTSTLRRTVLGSGAATVSTVEHLLAAVAANRIDDLAILVRGPELPQLDGSAAEFAKALIWAGVTGRRGSKSNFVVEQPLELAVGESSYAVQPHESFEIVVSLAWAHPLIGNQSFRCVVTPEHFAAEMAGARTFGFLQEVDALQGEGLARGVDASSGIALSGDGIVHGLPLRWPDEFARHKALDLLGDLALLGGGLTGKIVAHKPGHTGNIALARVIRERVPRTSSRAALVAGGP